MREIKFRGKRVDNGEWVYGYYRKTIFRNKILKNKPIMYEKHFIGKIDNIEYFDELFEQVEVIPETVGQFTGLTDKNGKEIYEGDIVKYYITKDYTKFYLTTVNWGIKSHGYKLMCDTKIYEKWGGVKYYSLPPAYWAEVISNIHDNKELLK